jgi:ABC-2 type transport system ATP-binding protein
VAIINRGKVVATNTPEQLMAELTSGSGYELDVKGDAGLVQPQLQAILGVKSAEIVTADHLPPDRRLIKITLESGAAPGHSIAATVVAAGLGLYEMKRTSVSLEDVFLQLTTEEKPLPEAAEPTQPETAAEEADAEPAAAAAPETQEA